MKGQPFKKALEVLKGVAPTAVAALGGPLAPVAAGVIRQVLDVGATADLDAAVLAAAGNPDAVVKLREIEERMAAKEQELGVRFEEIAAADRASARARQVALKDTTPAILTYLLFASFTGTVAYVLVYGLPEQGGEALMLLLGQLSAAFAAGVAYHLGSSAGSMRKTDLMTSSGRH